MRRRHRYWKRIRFAVRPPRRKRPGGRTSFMDPLRLRREALRHRPGAEPFAGGHADIGYDDRWALPLPRLRVEDVDRRGRGKGMEMRAVVHHDAELDDEQLADPGGGRVPGEEKLAQRVRAVCG